MEKKQKAQRGVRTVRTANVVAGYYGVGATYRKHTAVPATRRRRLFLGVTTATVAARARVTIGVRRRRTRWLLSVRVRGDEGGETVTERGERRTMMMMMMSDRL